jgi:S-(hydroxymethyl)glutathione dehydrogenase/alcohol dehydrogenase
VPAGLLLERGGAVAVEDVLVDPPAAGEIRVRVSAAGLCHTDFTANRDAPAFPVLLGHEGAGIVESIGPGVTEPGVGARVVNSWRVPCGRCPACRRARQPWCESPLSTGGPRLHRAGDGAAVIPFLRAGTFCPYVVVPAQAAIPVPDELPFPEAALIGCGVATGVGAALFEDVLAPGMDVAVIGLGGVGLNVVQGAALAGAGQIVAIDLLEEKIALAREFGATHGMRSGAGMVEEVVALTAGRGVDVVFEVVGLPELMEQAVAMLAPGGTLVLVGAAARDARMHFAPRRFMSRQQRIQGSIYGACRPAEHFPLFARWALNGKLRIRPLISRTIDSLDDINDAFNAMRRGALLRTVLLFPRDA